MKEKTDTPTLYQPEFGYAGFWRRFAAHWLDSLIVGIIAGASYSISGDDINQSSLIAFIISVGYYLFLWVKFDGQTIGKKIMGVRILKETGESIDLGTGVVRFFSYYLSSLVFCLGYISAAFDKKKQGWHDKIANTIVVKTDDRHRTGIYILMGLVCLLITGLFVVIILAAIFSVQNKDLKSKLDNRPSTTIQTSNISDDTFSLINEKRAELKLNQLELENRFCAYAQRRLQQLNSFGKYDDGKGFFEDTADSAMTQSYFKGYSAINENVYNLSSTSTAKNIVDHWTSTAKSNLTLPKNYAGCVRANQNFVIFISGLK
ncbi:MAG TPA: RDD family protein [Candidatus Woesebacteria bacterium]|nr:RDD family protein [Candidatus Woesebacteria bacterium]